MKNKALYWSFLAIFALTISTTQDVYAKTSEIQITNLDQDITLNGGDVYRITWDSTNIDFVTINWFDTGSTEETIAQNIKSVGYYDWKTFSGHSVDRKVKIRLIATGLRDNPAGDWDVDPETIKMVSSPAFITIKGIPLPPPPPPPVVRFVTPVEGEVWETGKTYPVTFHYENIGKTWGSVTLNSSDYAMSDYVSRDQIILDPSKTEYTINYTVPEKILSGNTYFIKLYYDGKADHEVKSGVISIKRPGVTLPPTSQPQALYPTPWETRPEYPSDTSVTLYGSVYPHSIPNVRLRFVLASEAGEAVYVPVIPVPVQNELFEGRVTVTDLKPNTRYNFEMFAETDEVSMHTNVAWGKQFTTGKSATPIQTTVTVPVPVNNQTSPVVDIAPKVEVKKVPDAQKAAPAATITSDDKIKTSVPTTVKATQPIVKEKGTSTLDERKKISTTTPQLATSTPKQNPKGWFSGMKSFIFGLFGKK